MKQKAISDANLRSFFFEAFYYLIFIAVILLAAFQNIDNQSFKLKEIQEKTLGFKGSNSTLSAVKTSEDVWKWISNKLAPSLKLRKWYV